MKSLLLLTALTLVNYTHAWGVKPERTILAKYCGNNEKTPSGARTITKVCIAAVQGFKTQLVTIESHDTKTKRPFATQYLPISAKYDNPETRVKPGFEQVLELGTNQITEQGNYKLYVSTIASLSNRMAGSKFVPHKLAGPGFLVELQAIMHTADVE